MELDFDIRGSTVCVSTGLVQTHVGGKNQLLARFNSCRENFVVLSDCSSSSARQLQLMYLQKSQGEAQSYAQAGKSVRSPGKIRTPSKYFLDSFPPNEAHGTDGEEHRLGIVINKKQ